mmetsp:Transcript_48458/g.110044  ORF Transcript_48458/g.110044 Transcript_48458/m.110044 type:complete len:82 (-) Transcript_48458:885-1130(-)
MEKSAPQNKHKSTGDSPHCDHGERRESQSEMTGIELTNFSRRGSQLAINSCLTPAVAPTCKLKLSRQVGFALKKEFEPSFV